MTVLLFITYTLLHRLPLRPVQVSVVKVDLGLSLRQLGPLQPVKRIVREENLPYEWAGEECIFTLECVQHMTRAGEPSDSEALLANSHNRCDSRSFTEFSLRNDLGGFA